LALLETPRVRIPLHSSRIRFFLSHPTLSSQATSGAGVSCRRGGRRSCDGTVPSWLRRSHAPMRHPSPRRPQPRAWHRSPPSSPDYPSSQARRPPRTSRPASATPGPRATVFPSSCASRAWFGWRTIAQQSLPSLSAAAPLQRRAASMRRFSLPTPAPKATRQGRARQRSRPRARRSRRTLLLRPRTRKRRSRRAVRTIAATSTGMALRPGARAGSTIGQRAVTRQGSETTSGTHTVAGASRPISGKVDGASGPWSNGPDGTGMDSWPNMRSLRFFSSFVECSRPIRRSSRW
jgi:hypothetical protein